MTINPYRSANAARVIEALIGGTGGAVAGHHYGDEEFPEERTASAIIGALMGAGGASGLSRLIRLARKSRLRSDPRVRNYLDARKNRRAIAQILGERRAFIDERAKMVKLPRHMIIGRQGPIPSAELIEQDRRIADKLKEMQHFKRLHDKNPIHDLPIEDIRRIRQMHLTDYAPVDRTLFGVGMGRL